MRHYLKEKWICISLVIITIVMTIFRFLLNEKGRVSPDSIRFMRTAVKFPEIDNTTTPLGYPLSIKVFTLFGVDAFWSSKIVGILAYIMVIWFVWYKKFYIKELIFTCALFSYVSIFSFTMSEPLILPFVVFFLYISRNTIVGKYRFWEACMYLSISLILLYSIRYSALFIILGTLFYGSMYYKKAYGKIMVLASCIGLGYVAGYKIWFIDYYNAQYVAQFLEIGIHPSSKLIIEFFQGIFTTFNPFVHIANPNGGVLNIAIYGIGALNVFIIIFLFLRLGLTETEKFLISIGLMGILCSFGIQYFYSVNPLDYRLLSPFVLPIWLVYFKKLFSIFGWRVSAIAYFSLVTGFIFSYLSKGNYIENRKIAEQFLLKEKMRDIPLLFYIEDEENLNEMKIIELIATVNPNTDRTTYAKDTLEKKAIPIKKIVSKIKIKRNKFQ